MIENPYLEEAKKRGVIEWSFGGPTPSMTTFNDRSLMITKYGFSIPNQEAVHYIADLSPVIETFAGSGYWSWMLKQAGCDVVSTDDHSWPSVSSYPLRFGKWAEVKNVKAQNAAKTDRTLMMSWPPMSDAAAEALSAYLGNDLVYIGEGREGCTANLRFFDILEDEWELVNAVNIPRHLMIHDVMYHYTRKNKNKIAQRPPVTGWRADVISSSPPLHGFVPGKKIIVNDKMQQGYEYVLKMPIGDLSDIGMRPFHSPAEMMALGVFEGHYFTDCIGELPREWLLGARISPLAPNIRFNHYGEKSRSSLAEWRSNGWIAEQDPRGWFQWFYRAYLGRRTDDDERQVCRWRNFAPRHQGQIISKAKKLGKRADDLDIHPRQRQGLLQWSHDHVMAGQA